MALYWMKFGTAEQVTLLVLSMTMGNIDKLRPLLFSWS